MTKTVMVVDDEPDLLATIVQVLDANNYRTIQAKDGRECLDRLKEDIPNIILLDIMMPGLTTEEILSAIEKDHPITYNDVDLSRSSLVYRIRKLLDRKENRNQG